MSDYSSSDGSFSDAHITSETSEFPSGCSAQGTMARAQLNVWGNGGGENSSPCSNRFPCICLAPAKSTATVYSDGTGGQHIHIAHGLPENQTDYFIEVSLKWQHLRHAFTKE